MICNICLSETRAHAVGRVLGKYDVNYFLCPQCGYIQTEAPYWLDEAYASAITNSDLGLVSRNVATANLTRTVITSFFNANAKFVDYGGGYGLFVRFMRDAGFDFYRYDKYCENIFAKQFDADDQERHRYELLTAFELFEHLVEPRSEIERMLHFSPNILCTSLLVPRAAPKPGEWWYYGLKHGQHVSLYSRKSLEILAEHFGLSLYTNGSNLHLLTEKTLPSWLYAFITQPRIAKMIALLRRRPSLLETDYAALVGRHQ